MKKEKINLLYMIIILTAICILLTGCNSIIPGDTVDDKYDHINTEMRYIRIVPAKLELKINQPQVFEVKAYNSDNKLVAMNISQIKWVVMYECSSCGIVWNISPTKGSQKTTFTPKKEGRYIINVNYKDEWGKATVTVK